MSTLEQPRIAEDVEELEKILDAPHCELRHIRSTCTHTPVALKHVDCTGHDFLACMGAVLAWPVQMLEGRLCRECKRKQSECWSYGPLGGEA